MTEPEIRSWAIVSVYSSSATANHRAPFSTYNVLEDTSEGEDETRADADEEDGSDLRVYA